MIPAAPDPVIARPTKNPAKLGASPVTTVPKAKTQLETNMQMRGEKILQNRPRSGEVLDREICCNQMGSNNMQAKRTTYTDVSQLDLDKASRSVATLDWIVVKAEMLLPVLARQSRLTKP